MTITRREYMELSGKADVLDVLTSKIEKYMKENPSPWEGGTDEIGEIVLNELDMWS